jgi:DNA mismatch repair protein MSH3
MINSIDIAQLNRDTSRYTEIIDAHAALNEDIVNVFKDDVYREVSECKQAIEKVHANLEQERIAAGKALGFACEYLHMQQDKYLIELSNKTKVPADWIVVNKTAAKTRVRSQEMNRLLSKLAQKTESLSAAATTAWDLFLSYARRCALLIRLQRIQCKLQRIPKRHFVACNSRLPVVAERACSKRLRVSWFVLCADSRVDEPAEIVHERQIHIVNGKHPLLNDFIPNDTDLSHNAQTCMMITGPNMGGKSSYVRQVALILILAQIGAAIPADSARLSPVDAIFTRMGASDNVSRGESTFMIEMEETAHIIQQSTSRSLLILDELGRGTSTHDGVAIAFSILKHVMDSSKAFTLFVTHYPSLAELELLYPTSLRTYHMSFVEESDENDVKIVFLYKLVKGMAPSSFGMNVGRLAGIPNQVLKRAIEKSAHLRERVEQRRVLAVSHHVCASRSVSELLELQRRASSLVKQ